MERDRKSADGFARLWQQAEQALQDRSAEAGALAAQDVQRVLHDLQVYQIELELQNEELQRAHGELEAARDRYSRLYDFAPIGYFTLDETGRIREANLKGAAMLGIERGKLAGQRLARFVAAEDQDAFHLYSIRLSQASEPQVCELCMVRRDGSEFHARLEGVRRMEPPEDEGMEAEPSAAHPPIYQVTVSDVSRRAALEEALREANEELELRIAERTAELAQANRQVHALAGSLARERSMLETIMQHTDTMLAYFDRDFRFVRVNAAYLRSVGFTIQELIGRNHFELYPHPENQAIFEQVRDTGEPVTFQARPFVDTNQPEHGTTYWDWTLAPVKDERGQVVGLVLSLQDVTERRETELERERLLRQLESERALLLAVIENAPDGILVADAIGRIVLSNPAAERLHAWRLPYGEEYESHAALGLCYPDGTPYDPRDLPLTRAALDGETHSRVEMTVVWPDGQRRRLLKSAAPIRDGQGQLSGAVAVVEDITERRELKERLAYQALLLENVHDAIVATDTDLRITAWNRAAEQLYGWQAAEVMGRPVVEVVRSEFSAEERQQAIDALTEPGMFDAEVRQQTRDGRAIVVEGKGVSVRDAGGTIIGFVVANRDITKRKLAEAALRESEERFRTLADGAPVLIWVNGLEGCEFVNRAYLDFLGVSSQAEVQGYDWLPFLHPDDREGYLNAYVECFARQAPFEARFRFRRQDGVYRWMNTSGQPRFTPTGEFLGYVGSTVDITDIQEAEEARRRHADQLEELVARRTAALQTSEARFRAIFEGAAFGIAITGLDGRLIASNPALQAMLGFSDQELIRKAFSEFTHPEDVVGNLMVFQELAAGQREAYQLEKRYLRKDGEVIWARLAVSLVRGADGQPEFAVTVVEDITRQKQAQAALVQSEKLAVVGRLTASLTHEINNPLQSVLGCLGLADEALAEGGDVGPFLDVAREELRRTARIVGQLRDLHRRPQGGQREPADIQAAIEQVLALNRPRCRALGVEVEWEPAEGLPLVSAGPGQLQQVFLNLLLNALDAMPHGGRLRVSADATIQPGGVRVRVEDSGVGIPEHALPRIFDPFFTTRDDGLGLGLFVCHNIVVEHGGHIEAESRVGQGATFTVWLPESETALEG